MFSTKGSLHQIGSPDCFCPTKLVHLTNFVHQNWSAGPLFSVKTGPSTVGPILFVKNGPTLTKVVLPGPLCHAKMVLLGPLTCKNSPIPKFQCNQLF